MSDIPKDDKKAQEVKSEIKKHHKDAAEDKSKAEKKDDSPATKIDVNAAKIEELTNDLKRVQADFENYKKRVDKESTYFREYACSTVVKKLLAVLDSFEMALKNTDDQEAFIKGVELIYSQLYNVLKEEGLEYIDVKGKKLDPHLHDVMLSEKSEDPEDTIIEELQKGYRLKGAVLRHSKVKVAKK
ncbi:MAG: nucleotide exchange factor GrpE [Candidatus Woesearchaeota archaeon]